MSNDQELRMLRTTVVALTEALEQEHNERRAFEQTMNTFSADVYKSLAFYCDQIAAQKANTQRWDRALGQVHDLLRPVIARLFPNMMDDFEAIDRAVGLDRKKPE